MLQFSKLRVILHSKLDLVFTLKRSKKYPVHFFIIEKNKKKNLRKNGDFYVEPDFHLTYFFILLKFQPSRYL